MRQSSKKSMMMMALGMAMTNEWNGYGYPIEGQLLVTNMEGGDQEGNAEIAAQRMAKAEAKRQRKRARRLKNLAT